MPSLIHAYRRRAGLGLRIRPKAIQPLTIKRAPRWTWGSSLTFDGRQIAHPTGWRNRPCVTLFCRRLENARTGRRGARRPAVVSAWHGVHRSFSLIARTRAVAWAADRRCVTLFCRRIGSAYVSIARSDQLRHLRPDSELDEGQKQSAAASSSIPSRWAWAPLLGICSTVRDPERQMNRPLRVGSVPLWQSPGHGWSKVRPPGIDRRFRTGLDRVSRPVLAVKRMS